MAWNTNVNYWWISESIGEFGELMINWWNSELATNQWISEFYELVNWWSIGELVDLVNLWWIGDEDLCWIHETFFLGIRIYTVVR